MQRPPAGAPETTAAPLAATASQTEAAAALALTLINNSVLWFSLDEENMDWSPQTATGN